MNAIFTLENALPMYFQCLCFQCSLRSNFVISKISLICPDFQVSIDIDNSPLHVGISLRSVLKSTLSGSLSVTLADESWKSPLIEDKKYN